ncbi:2-succinyl-5-enolpyruvyl-6-hydroxy-3-cyclohexene-1-carboxylic-acid synthase [Prevotella stercorea]|uniref:2-succinyl-5-enolpyruvyl-6-hydroxy-3- cyclohexene-1-carboxylic-acid synthase n=1 Tax=Leyella stercorea TaxID=363265 RepID=UPI001F2DACE1|nr:2-succinyl-5-enolpyruvyl-6-hydroxy-3-cyclohexene-1-carboxylic-acid synthase [Leyella stercorea]MCF2644552.1 2-succinyl-5-enolpyruvyl-6-hydroxy-3-cyclohexene-1-carboxylic-acid synthase [Leyella stercorea]MCF2644575.1 2-succinyl-5-enolpyruvyl-6-hydroxy-3-cyclohexene-1-carboxylic-acid synthase [Leyella stercorea]
MYSNKENVNILTSLLLEYGVSDAVVCPGSRNAPIVHNLSVCEAIRCRPVTDERSAAFYALGLAIATRRPTVVCVTSGSALLNVMPAVAEAAYQHVPLVVISADRPQQWIDQLDGQTIPQSDALGRFVRKAVQLPEPHNDEERWLCRRLVNEAMHLATCRQDAPVHINVPISEPLFEFSTEQLPQLSRFNNIKRAVIKDASMDMPDAFHEAKRPMIVIGQLAHGTISHETIRSLSERYVVMSEPLSNPSYMTIHFDEAIRYIVSDNSSINDDEDDKTAYYPDYVIYVGDTLVSKPARRFLRNAKAPSCLITPDAADIHDPLMTLTDIVECDTDSINALLASLCETPDTDERCRFHDRWQSFLDACAAHADAYAPEYSQMATVKYFEEQLADLDIDICVHYANSSAVRLACIYAQHYVWCNRGVNGIEGSLSTAAGFSLATHDMTVCVIGDLSFFYDQNALWNSNLRGNLRIILLNNRGGGIFRQLPGLSDSPAADDLVMASHENTAQGICTQNDIGYMSAKNMDEMQIGIVTLLTRESERPMLLEVFTDSNDDVKALEKYFKL